MWLSSFPPGPYDMHRQRFELAVAAGHRGGPESKQLRPVAASKSSVASPAPLREATVVASEQNPCIESGDQKAVTAGTRKRLRIGRLTLGTALQWTSRR